MKYIGKKRHKKLDDLVGELNAAHEAISEAVDTFNGEIEGLLQPITEAIDAYNEVAGNANDLLMEVHADLDSYIDERSDRWLEGERGEAMQAMRDEWAIELEACQLEEPQPMDVPEGEGATQLEQLPTEVDL